MYPQDGVVASGLAALRTLVADQLSRTVPAYAVPVLATSGPTVPGPAYALAEIGTATGRRTRGSQPRAQAGAERGTHAR